jgi:Zn-dependent peptidase ImmA (M78 family)/DNA-binding XRE family transcriptional regulator
MLSMARTPSAPANAALLEWARKDAGLSPEEAARRLNVNVNRLLSWETGESKPTINQLRKAAYLYRQTPAYLLAANLLPPADTEANRPPDFRSLRAEEERSPEVRREVARALNRRSVYIDLCGQGTRSLPEIPNVLGDPVAAASIFREALEVRDGVRFEDANNSLWFWIERLEELGVLVFQMSRVDPDECRGISIWQRYCPVVILNGGDEVEARVFTLLHEVAHLLAHQGGVCTVWTGAAVEAKCNAFAGACLIPERTLNRELAGEDPIEAMPRLAARFHTSQSTVAIRLRDLGYIDQVTLEKQLVIAIRLARERRERAKAKAREKSGGPLYHRIQLRNLGLSYVSAVLDALNDNRITPVDASYYLESKLSTIDRMEGELATRSANAQSVLDQMIAASD